MLDCVPFDAELTYLPTYLLFKSCDNVVYTGEYLGVRNGTSKCRPPCCTWVNLLSSASRLFSSQLPKFLPLFMQADRLPVCSLIPHMAHLLKKVANRSSRCRACRDSPVDWSNRYAGQHHRDTNHPNPVTWIHQQDCTWGSKQHNPSHAFHYHCLVYSSPS